MSRGFTQDFIKQLKERSDIGGVIGRYVRLDKKGRHLWACCPFHQEKTPSFSVNEENQFFHCFGCGKGGDVISFVKDIESLEYIDAVKLLAEWANMRLPDIDYDDEQVKKNRQKKERLLSILHQTAKFYMDNLNSGGCDKHIEYIINRRISSQTVRRFGIGASVNFDALPLFLLSKGFSEQELTESGVCDEKNGRIYDSLGGRLIFPIINAYGDVIAFGGRLMEKADFAKYKNTKETPIFNKSANLYNINLLKAQKQQGGIDSVIVVEGYMDVLSLYQAGFKNTVASMGTSLTKDQARLLKRYSQNIFISYDGDAAGAKATVRGLDILESESLAVKVISLPSGKDPDDVIKANGAEFYKQLISDAAPLYDYKLSLIKSKYDLEQTDEKRQYVSEMLSAIRAVESAAVREEYLKRLRDESGISFEALKRDLENIKAAAPAEKAAEIPIKQTDSLTEAGRFVVASVIFDKRYALDFDIKSISFDNNVHNVIIEEIYRQREKGGVMLSMLYELDLTNEQTDELSAVLAVGQGELINGDIAVAAKYFKDSVRLIKLDKINREIKMLTEAAQSQIDIARRREIMVMIETKKEESKAFRN